MRRPYPTYSYSYTISVGWCETRSTQLKSPRRYSSFPLKGDLKGLTLIPTCYPIAYRALRYLRSAEYAL